MPRNRLPPVSLGCSAAESLREGGLGGGVTRERPSPAGGPPCHQGPLGKQSARVSCVPRAGVRGGSVAWGDSGPRAQTQSHKPSFVHTASRPSFHSSALCILQPCRLLISELTQHPSSGAKVIKSGTGGGRAVHEAWDPAVHLAGSWWCAWPGLGGARGLGPGGAHGRGSAVGGACGCCLPCAQRLCPATVPGVSGWVTRHPGVQAAC